MGSNKKIILLGAGGHCLSVLDTLLSSYQFEKIGIVDKGNYEYGMDQIMGVPVLGGDEALITLLQEGYTDAFIAVGSVGDYDVRKRLYHQVKEIGYHIPNIIDQTSVISEFAALGEGIYIGKRAVVNAFASIETMAILNTSCTIEHNCRIGAYVHVAPGSVICGNVQVGEGTHIGAGSVIKQGLHIGVDTMVGVGSVVVTNIGSQVIAYGNPCRVRTSC
ncbi:MAG: sugar O-acyltransferase, sialic acid O-acetyltransferase NeuD family [Herbinix sp.]|jgi:sugar O-acyltransferase (sialic acid O-acetyltransferase NeuD family)|nr:sugar O-acyltransferase, sialic acid O-acetyltransferase NeuD family [Herbinix sp.]